MRVADAGADGISPSDMMDGRTAHLRAALDDGGHDRVPIMSYSTKFASQLLWTVPRCRGRSAPQLRRPAALPDRRAVSDRRDRLERALREEGADLLMVKPGLTSLDLIVPIREATGQAGRRLSGERRIRRVCSRSAAHGLADFDAALLETWHVFRRAGAAYIITYGARRARRSECRCDRSRQLFATAH